jgi:uncharacterized surface protein with fasciclin (FAS1) repeats
MHMPVNMPKCTKERCPLSVMHRGNITVAGPGNSGNPAIVIQPDVSAGLSVIHVIDKVLLPPISDIMAALAK